MVGGGGGGCVHSCQVCLGYTEVTDKVQHLLCFVKEHLITKAPQAVAAISPFPHQIREKHNLDFTHICLQTLVLCVHNF